MISKKNNIILESKDKYSAEYYSKLTQYFKSDERIYDNVLNTVYENIKQGAEHRKNYVTLSLYSNDKMNSDYYQMCEYNDLLRDKVMKLVIDFLRFKGFHVYKKGIQVTISWN